MPCALLRRADGEIGAHLRQKEWCAENGRKEPGTLHSFARDLRAAVSGLRTRNLRTGDGRERFYEGIDLAHVAPSMPELPSDW